MRETDSQSDETVRLLKDILTWTKIGAMQLKSVLLDEAKTDRDRLVYELSDGERSSRDVERETEVDHSIVADLWKKWAEIGTWSHHRNIRGVTQGYVH